MDYIPTCRQTIPTKRFLGRLRFIVSDGTLTKAAQDQGTAMPVTTRNKNALLLKATHQQLVMESGAVLGQTVDAVKTGVVVNPEIDKTNGFEKRIDFMHLARSKTINGAVDNFVAFETRKNTNAKRGAIVSVVFESTSPFGNLGVVVGRWLSGAKMNFHFAVWVVKSRNVKNALRAYHYTKKYYSKFVRVPA
jgi:hypothetical protein